MPGSRTMPRPLRHCRVLRGTAGNGNVSSLWLLPGDDARGSAYPALQLDPGVELQGHPSGKLSPSLASKEAAFAL